MQPNAQDQYDVDSTLGKSKGPAILIKHYESWVTEDDIETLYQFGINHLRVPVGYWAFIDPIPGDPFVQANQTGQLDRIIGLAAARNMSVLIDLHSMPGLESSWQSGGRSTSDDNIHFYDTDLQQYNDRTVQAVLQYINKQPQRNTISGIGLVNEPTVFANQTRRTALQDFYSRSYQTMMQNAYKVPLIIHHGYQGLDAWKDFAAQHDPSLLVWEGEARAHLRTCISNIAADHPYPGTFSNKGSSSDAILSSVCSAAKGYADFVAPVSLTEFTLEANVDGLKFWKQQVSAWSWSGGMFFWSMRCNSSTNWSLLDLIASKKFPSRPPFQSVQDYITSMGDPCGKRPAQAWQH